METCEGFYKKIISFDDLLDEEQQEVKLHAERCPKCREHLREFQAIMTAIKKANFLSHIDDELLTRYGVHLSDPRGPDYNGRRLTREEITRIKNHVDLCPSCRHKVNLITQEYGQIEEYLQEVGLPYLKLSKSSAWIADIVGFLEIVTSFWKKLILLPRPKVYPVAAAALASLLILFLLSTLFFGGGNIYYKLSVLEKPNVASLTRSGISKSISDGILAFDKGNYTEAIQNFGDFIEKYPDDPLLFYAYHILGITWLLEAKSDMLGRFPKFDIARVDKGIQCLQKALTLSGNPRIREDCYWYLGKAFLMKKEGTNAKEAFEKVVELKGRRFVEAQQIIAEIEKIPLPQE